MYTKSLLLLILTFGAVNAFGQTQTKIENDTEYKSIALKSHDKTFLALKDTAQKHISEFVESVGNKKRAYQCLIKSDFVYNGIHEHMWSRVYEFRDGRFTGIFIDSPFDLKNIKTGDQINVAKDNVEDWGVFDIEGRQIAGMFSDKYLKSKK